MFCPVLHRLRGPQGGTAAQTDVSRKTSSGLVWLSPPLGAVFLPQAAPSQPLWGQVSTLPWKQLALTQEGPTGACVRLKPKVRYAG